MQSVCERVLKGIIEEKSDPINLGPDIEHEVRMEIMYWIDALLQNMGYIGLVSLNIYADDSAQISYNPCEILCTDTTIDSERFIVTFE